MKPGKTTTRIFTKNVSSSKTTEGAHVFFGGPVNKWQTPSPLSIRAAGDAWMKEEKYLGVSVRSIVNVAEYNWLLNPLFPGFTSLVQLHKVTQIDLYGRLLL